MTLITELPDERLEKNYFVRDVILMRDSLRVALTEKAEKEDRIRRMEDEYVELHKKLAASEARVKEVERALKQDRRDCTKLFGWMEDLLMGTIPEYPECGNIQALAELRRKAKEGL